MLSVLLQQVTDRLRYGIWATDKRCGAHTLQMKKIVMYPVDRVMRTARTHLWALVQFSV